MQRSLLFPVGLVVLALAAGLAVADPPRPLIGWPGGAKMWQWTLDSSRGYNEPPRQPNTPEPAQPPRAAFKYRVEVYTMTEKTTGDEANKAVLIGHLPEDADIWFEGVDLGRKNVPLREFVSPELVPGKNYVYDVRVNWVEDGHRAEQDLKVRVHAGDLLCLDLRAAKNKDAEAEIKANLDKLEPEDRKLAEAQVFCAVQEGNPLGAMGVPVKVLVKGQPVFLCCKGCAEKARNNPEQTLATVKELRARHTTTPRP
jgi:uncharacterized protein (TIGR03000 family)